MSNYRALHIERNKLDDVIEEFGKRSSSDVNISKKILNEASHQNRYTVSLDTIKFEVDFFFKNDGKTTMNPIGKGDSLVMATELCEYICDCIAYMDVESGKFNIPMPKERFELLREYLCSIEGVKILRNEKVNNQIGEILQLTSDIGDKITLTYYSSTENLFFDGFLMKLHAEVKCFLAAYQHVETVQRINGVQNSKKIEEKIAKLLERSYNNLNTLLQNLLFDSVSQITYRVPSKDYSVWAFPALKALEGRIKDILKRNSVIINDRVGFAKKVVENSEEITKPIFIKHDTIPDKFIIDTSIINITDVNTLEELSNCYTYFNKNRHILFHTKQNLALTRTLKTPEEGESIVFAVCNLFEESYNKLGY